MRRNRTASCLGVMVFWAVNTTGLLAAQETPDVDSPELQEPKPKLAVVIGHTGQASAELARDLQEVMVAALSDREGFSLVGKEDLQNQAGFSTETEMITCLVEPSCEEALRTRQNIKILVLGKIDKSDTHFEFTIQMIRDSGGEYSKIFRVPQSEGLDGLLEKLFEIAAQLPINEGPIPVVVKDDPKPDEGLSGLGWTGVGLVGVSAASLITAVIFTVQHQSSGDTLQSDIDSAQIVGGGAQGITRARAKELEDDANTSATTANILYTASLGLAVVGGALFATDLLMRDSTETDVDGSEEQVRVTPWASEEVVGGVLELRW